MVPARLPAEERARHAHPLPVAHRSSERLTLNVARIAHGCEVLGPGTRRVMWVQGCALRCAGCVVPESHALAGGRVLSPEQAASELLAGPPADGVTFSGGEPFLQARALAQTVRLLRAARPAWSFMSYSGYRLQVIAARGCQHQRALLDELDLLVDGPFVRGLAGDLRWRGSSNQRIWPLTARGRRQIEGLDDRSAGVEIELLADGALNWAGVPPDGFRATLDAAIAHAGLQLPNPDGAMNASPRDRRDS
jgi:anaerobic ribonucleoside-triphosphate reductase activating protein